MAFADAQNVPGSAQPEPNRSEDPVGQPDKGTAAPGMDRKALARQLLRDAGVPMAVYYGLHAAGASNLVALTGGTGRYRNATGGVQAMPAGGHAQRLTFSIGAA